MSNAPDEAERLLDELSKAVVYLERWKHRRDEDEQNWHDEANCERDVIRSQLLPLIRSGLALQRLEKAVRCQHYIDVTIKSNSKTRFNVLIDDEHDDSTFSMAVGDRESLTAAINAALDAAGVEK